MKRRTLFVATLTAGAVAVAAVAMSVRGFAQTPPQTAADVILTNGKIITVDNRFSIAQAVAVRGERIVAVGTNRRSPARRTEHAAHRSRGQGRSFPA